MTKLKPCPFCGGEVELLVFDDRGNFWRDEYGDEPFYDLRFELDHPVSKNPKCPIANFDGEDFGIHTYESREEAIEHWNKRFEEEKK